MSEGRYIILFIALTVASIAVWIRKQPHYQPREFGRSISKSEIQRSEELDKGHTESARETSRSVESSSESIREAILSRIADKKRWKASELMVSYAEKYPRESWNWIREISEDLSEADYGGIVNGWARGAYNFEKSYPLTVAKEVSDLQIQFRILQGFSSGVHDADHYEEGLAVLNDSELGVAARVISSDILESWVEQDEERFKEFLFSNTNHVYFDMMVGRLVTNGSWLKDRPIDTLDWLNSLDSAIRENLLPEAVSKWAGNEDPLLIMDWLQSNAPDMANDKMQASLSAKIAVENTELGLRMADTIADKKTQEHAYNKIWKRRAMESPKQAVEEALASTQPDDHLKRISVSLYRDSPDDAIEVASFIESEDARSERYQEILESWRTNPAMQRRMQRQIGQFEAR